MAAFSAFHVSLYARAGVPGFVCLFCVRMRWLAGWLPGVCWGCVCVSVYDLCVMRKIYNDFSYCIFPPSNPIASGCYTLLYSPNVSGRVN